jgi:hypothetical protein
MVEKSSEDDCNNEISTENLFCHYQDRNLDYQIDTEDGIIDRDYESPPQRFTMLENVDLSFPPVRSGGQQHERYITSLLMFSTKVKIIQKVLMLLRSFSTPRR